MKFSFLRSSLIAAFMLLASVSANAQYQILVIPDQPNPGHAFQIEIQGSTSNSPASVSEPIMQINESTIYLQVSADMGPWAHPSGYVHVFDIPPLGSGMYTIEFWESRLYDPDPAPSLVDSMPLQLQGNPIPALSISGVVVMILLIIGVALRSIGR
jgi:hypothetical protein